MSWWRRHRKNRNAPATRPHAGLEALEPRALLAATLVGDIPDFAISEPLDREFAAAVEGTVIEFRTSLGTFQLELFDAITPITVANFLDYLNDNDYNAGVSNNTFIHRSVDNFVVQAGGFRWNVPDPALPQEGEVVTIPTEAPILNEFDELKAHFGATAKINTRGRISMAKLGGNENSATSQWFFNLGDNSGNLDNQNGGFTTFGQVLYTGMTVVDAIGNVPQTNPPATDPDFGPGVFDALPLRNYFVPNSPIRTSNLVLFNDINIIGKPVYTITNDRPDLVTVTIEDGQVRVVSDASGTGTASITIAVSGAGPAVQEAFQVRVNAPIDVRVGDVTVAENDGSSTALIPVTLSHIPLDRSVTVTFSTADGDARAGFDFTAVLDEVVLFPPNQTTAFAAVPLIDDGEVEFNETFTVNFTAASSGGTMVDGQAIVTIDDDDSRQVALASGVPLRFIDGDNTLGMILLRGPGTATVAVPADGTAGDILIDLQGTTAASRLFIYARGGDHRLDIGSIDVNGDIGAIFAGRGDLDGNLFVNGTVGLIRLASASGTITLGIPLDGPAAANLRIGNAHDLSIESAMPIHSLFVGAWTDSDGNDLLQAPRLDLLRARSAFAPDLLLTGDGELPTLGSAFVRGNLDGSEWDLTGSMGRLIVGSVGPAWRLIATASIGLVRVGGDFSGDLEAETLGQLFVRRAILDAAIETTGNIGSIVAGAMRNSRVFAGVTPGLLTLPDDDTDFATAASIALVRLRGIRFDPLESFINSHIAASNITAALGSVDPTDAAPFGVAAQTLGPVSWRIGPTPFIARNATELAAIPFDDDFIVRLV